MPRRDTAKLIAVLDLGTQLLTESWGKLKFSHPASGRGADLVHQNHRRLMMLKAYFKIQVLKLMVPKGTAREPQRSGRGVGARVARKGSFQEEEVGKSVKCHREDSERRAWPLGGRYSACAAFGEAGAEALG